MSHDHRLHTPESHDPADAWHTHFEGEHAQAAHAENVDVPQVIAVGVAGFMLIVVAVIATIIYFNWYAHALFVAKVERGDLLDPGVTRIDYEYNEYRKRIESEQDNFGWVDGEKNVVRVPIHEAKKKMIETISKK